MQSMSLSDWLVSVGMMFLFATVALPFVGMLAFTVARLVSGFAALLWFAATAVRKGGR